MTLTFVVLVVLTQLLNPVILARVRAGPSEDGLNECRNETFWEATVCYSDRDKGSLELGQDGEKHLYTVVVENEGRKCFLSCTCFEVWLSYCFFEHFELKTYRNLIKVKLSLCCKNFFAPLS